MVKYNLRVNINLKNRNTNMDISFSEQDLQFQEEIRTGLNGAEYPAHVKEKQ